MMNLRSDVVKKAKERGRKAAEEGDLDMPYFDTELVLTFHKAYLDRKRELDRERGR